MLSMAFRYKVQEGHTWVRVFAGPDADHRAKCGDLTFLNEEWRAFRNWLSTHRCQAVPVEFVDETPQEAT